MKNKSYTKGDGIKSVSKLPACLIKLIGRIDSLKPPEVATAHLEKYYALLAKNEKDEALLAETALKKTRELGNKNLFIILRTDKTAPEVPSSDDSPAAKRAYSKSIAEHKKNMDAIAAAREALSEIDAAITSGNLVFEERLHKTRNKSMACIESYIKGVRSGKHPDFDPQITPDDLARTNYYNSHKETDDLIHTYAKEALS